LHRLVNLRNDSGVSIKLHLRNNILTKIGRLYEAADPAAKNWSVDGEANWVTSGTGGLDKVASTLSGSDPGFVDAAAKDFTLRATSACLGKAVVTANAPDKEYYRDETVKLQYRARASAQDIGAFERGTAGPPVGAYGQPPRLDAALLQDAGGRDWSPGDRTAPLADGRAAERGTGGDGDAGCSCQQGRGAATAGLLLLLVPSAWLARRRRRNPQAR